MVVKCKKCGKDITRTEYAKVPPYICGKCLKKEREEKILKTEEKPKENILGTIFGGIKKVSGSGKSKEVGEDNKEKQKEDEREKKLKERKFSSYEEELKEIEARKKVEEYRKKEAEKARRKGGFPGKIREYSGKAQEKWKTIKEVPIVGKRAETVKSHLTSAFGFPILFSVAVWSSITLILLPLEGYHLIPTVPTTLIHYFSEKIVIMTLALMIGVVLPPSLVLGKQGVDFKFLNQLCIYIIAAGASIWGTTNVFIPAMQTFMPEEYALMMCLIKYKGSTQICMGLGNQTVQYEKVGTYKTLTTQLGVVTPSKSIPPLNPIPYTWDDVPYILSYTLKNENEVGSPYNITVKDDITVIASPTSDYDPSIYLTGEVLNKPGTSIKPGGYWVMQTRFDLEPPQVNPKFGCDSVYTYFQINISTKQIGGGSSKMGLIESDEGVNNQNFMYFFDPDVKAESGPLDIYTYTLPFIIPANRVIQWHSELGYMGYDFVVYIHIINKGEGEATIPRLRLIQTTPGISLRNRGVLRQCNVMSFSQTIGIAEEIDSPTSTVSSSSCECPEDGKNDNDCCITFTGLPTILGGGSIVITCEGYIPNPGNFVGKSTQFISLDAEYEYKQTYDEQITCYKMPGETTTTTTTIVAPPYT